MKPTINARARRRAPKAARAAAITAEKRPLPKANHSPPPAAPAKTKKADGERILRGAFVLLGVSGGIAAYKAAELASRLTQSGAAVDVVMTEAATRFVAPLTFETLTQRRVCVGLWDAHEIEPEHISLADRPDLCIIAPATGNTLAKIAHGIADNLLTSTILACRAPLLLAPAMNENMWRHPATQENIRILRRRGAQMIGPRRGWLACGRSGEGRMAEAEEIFAAALKMLATIRRGKRAIRG